MKFQLPKIYPITDTRLSGLSHAEQVMRLLAGGARLIQLRDKHSSPREFLTAALAAVALARPHQVPIIINDRVDIALATGAAGVHLGQDDVSPSAARQILGDGAIIGFSTHTVAQALDAVSMPVDYIAIGPIFPTRTKEDPDEVIGLAGLSQVREAIGDMPLVAIGGIDKSSVLSVLAAGADSAASIGVLMSDPDKIEGSLQQLLDLTN